MTVTQCFNKIPTQFDILTEHLRWNRLRFYSNIPLRLSTTMHIGNLAYHSAMSHTTLHTHGYELASVHTLLTTTTKQ